MNKLEETISVGIRNAVEQYHKMAYAPLQHAPESFLQMKIVDALYAAGRNWIYPDISLGRVYRELEQENLNAPQSVALMRPDISVWYKQTSRIRAIIEIKRTHQTSPIIKDAKKICDIIKEGNGLIESGYIVSYFECKSPREKETLTKKFEGWAAKTGVLVGGPIGEIPSDISSRFDSYRTWGAAIIRVGMEDPGSL